MREILVTVRHVRRFLKRMSHLRLDAVIAGEPMLYANGVCIGPDTSTRARRVRVLVPIRYDMSAAYAALQGALA